MQSATHNSNFDTLTIKFPFTLFIRFFGLNRIEVSTGFRLIGNFLSKIKSLCRAKVFEYPSNTLGFPCKMLFKLISKP